MGGRGSSASTPQSRVTSIREVTIDYSGMRPESLDIVRGERASGKAMRPIVVEVWPGKAPILTDGRHRLTVARERGDTQISAIVREYSRSGKVVSTQHVTLTL